MQTGTSTPPPGFTHAPGQARAFWTTGAGAAELRLTELPRPASGEVRVRTLCSAVSRGTESLVHSGRVPARSREAMRAPFQEGEFTGPVKYGYLSVGVVDEGPPGLLGRTVFCLHPHQTAYVVPVEAVTPVPDRVPPRRAVLAGLVETAVNALWDAAPLVGDRVAVVGAGALGCCVARLLSRIPGVEVTLVDIDPGRAGVAAALGVGFAAPAEAAGDRDLVVHTSATAAGLRRSMELLRRDGVVVELSWFGAEQTSLRLGDVFHSERLTIRSSQVGTISPARQGSRTHADRMRLALELLTDAAFDALLTTESTFEELPAVMPLLMSGELRSVTHLVTYPAGPEGVGSCSP